MKVKILITSFFLLFITNAFSQSKWNLNFGYENAYKFKDILKNQSFNGLFINPEYIFKKRIRFQTGLDLCFNHQRIDYVQPSIAKYDNKYTYYINLPLSVKYSFIQFEHFHFYAKTGILFQSEYLYAINDMGYSLSNINLYTNFAYGLGTIFLINEKWSVFLESSHTLRLAKHSSSQFIDTKLGASLSF